MSGVYNQQSLEANFAAISQRCAALEAQVALLSERLGIPFTTVTSRTPDEVVALVRAGRKLEALKRYRELTGATFEDARLVVDGI
jgi:ribosomal protein L7/L12